MSNKIVPGVYRTIIDDVVSSVRSDFDEHGIEEDILAILQQKWESKLLASRVADFEPPPPPPQPQYTYQPQMPVFPPGYNPSNPYQYNPQQSAHSQYSHLLPNLASSNPPRPTLPNLTLPGLTMPNLTLPSLPGLAGGMTRPGMLPGGGAGGMQGRPGGAAPSGMTTQQQQAQQQRQLAAAVAHIQQQYQGGLKGGAEGGEEGPQRLRGGAAAAHSDDDSSSDDPDSSPAAGTSSSNKPLPPAPPPPVGQPGVPNENGIRPGDEQINSDLDDSDDEQDEEEGEGGVDENMDIVFCTYDKVQRVKNKWKMVFKDGVAHVNGRDYLFSKCTSEFEW